MTMSFIKQNTKLSFKEFNDEWAIAGNYSYTVQFRDKNKALDMEGYLIGLGYSPKYGGDDFAYWNHKLRKNFNIRINPKKKSFHRTSKVVSQNYRYKNIYVGNYFKNFCFKFVITEKTKLEEQEFY